MDEAQETLAEEDADLANLVKPRFFARLTHKEIAGVVELSELDHRAALAIYARVVVQQNPRFLANIGAAEPSLRIYCTTALK